MTTREPTICQSPQTRWPATSSRPPVMADSVRSQIADAAPIQ